MAEPKEGNGLQEVLVGYEAQDVLESDCWKGLCHFAAEYRNAKELKVFMKTEEEKYKSTYGVRSLPGRYRSAKSVLLRASSLGIAVMIRGNPVPKSVIERDIRQQTDTSIIAHSSGSLGWGDYKIIRRKKDYEIIITTTSHDSVSLTDLLHAMKGV